MYLYHGSNQIIERPRILPPTHPTDFGAGFYVTSNLAQARAFAVKVARRKGGGIPVVSGFECDVDALRRDFSVLRFAEPDRDWLRFVVDNRKGVDAGAGYDAVVGPVANDDVYRVVGFYESGDYSEAYALEQLKIKRLFIQHVFKTQVALTRLVFKGVEHVR